MNVVFWSPLSGHGATTSNMACLALMSSLMYCYKTISFQSGYSYNNLDQTFIGGTAVASVNTVNEEFAYYMGKGIDGILGSIFMDSFVNEKIVDYSVEIVKGLSYYLPSTMKSNEDLFNNRMSANIFNLLEECSKSFDMTFVDNQSKVDKVSKNIFLKADLCVINVNQNPEMIIAAKKEFEKLNSSCKVIYVIGRYDNSNRFSVKNIAKKLGISAEDIGVVPYCSEYMEAILMGKTKEFLKSNFNCRRRDDNFYFISEVKNMTNKIIRKAGVAVG